MSTLIGSQKLASAGLSTCTRCPMCRKEFSNVEVDEHVEQCIKNSMLQKPIPITEQTTAPLQFQKKKLSPDSSPPLKFEPRPTLSPPSPISLNIGRSVLRSSFAKQQIEQEKESIYSMYTGKVPNMTPSAKNWDPIPKLPDCPTFYPTEQEFQDPMKYIASIREIGKKAGICKIVPPSDKWLQGKSFSKVVSSKNFIFQTKLQNIHQLQIRSGPNERFLEELEDFLKKKNTPMKSIPMYDGQELDLYQLYHAVKNRGGVHEVTNSKKWKEIAKDLKLTWDPNSSAQKLKESYQKYLYSYEIYQKARKEHEKNMKCENSKRSSMSASNLEEEGFGYHDGKMFTLSSYKKMADAFKNKWFPHDANPPEEVIENAYWRIVEQSEETVQVHYGSDLDVGTHGSGFPMDPEELKHASGWNLNIFAKLKNSLLYHLDEKTAGVIEPMMYIGMLFSTFCWHVEDNNLYSINYLHQGASKTWYGIPDTSADHFEEVMRKTVPELFKIHPNLLFMLVTMLSPRILVQNKVPVYHTVQREGEFMITFPKAYHAGFSHGFNCAESCNFALEDWLSYGRESLERYRYYGRSSVLSFEKLLCSAALSDHNEATREKLKEELPVMRRDEQWLREKVLIHEGLWKCVHFDKYEGKNADMKECIICHHDCYLSAIVCCCSPGRVVCLRHSDKLCKCEPGRKTLLFRWKLEDIDDMMKRVGCEEIQPLPINYMDVENNSSASTQYLSLGRGVAGKKNYDKKFVKLNGIHKRCIRRLARLGGIRKMKGVEYAGDSLNERMFIIEKIIDQRCVNGKLEYLLKWEGYPKEECTWETAENFYCPGLFEAFSGTPVVQTRRTQRKARSKGVTRTS